jgi:tetratricopeptide (TPR) repeat protein
VVHCGFIDSKTFPHIMTHDSQTLWISFELDPGTADFFGLPAQLSVPDDPRAPFLGGYDSQASLPALASALAKAVELDPDLSGRADVLRFMHRWPRYADLDRYLRMGNATFARTVAVGLLEDGRHDPPALATLALLSAQNGKWEEAVDFFERVRERAPTHAPSRLQYALCLAGAGRKAEAREHLDFLSHRTRVQSVARLWKHELVRQEVEDLADRLRAAMNNVFGLENQEDGEDVWAALSEAFPGNPEVLFARTIRGDACSDDVEREALLARALEADPGHVPAAAALAGFHRRAGRLDEALTLLDTALDQAPQNPLLLAVRGQTLEQLGRGGAALETYRSIFDQPLAHLPASALLMGGQGILRLDRSLSAKKLLEDSVEARPGDPIPHHLLARLDESRPEGREAAERRLREAIRACGPLPLLQYALGDLLRRSGRRVEAEGLMKVLLRRHPGTPWGHRGLGDLVVETEPARAMEHYAKAIQIDPSIPIPGFDYLCGVSALRSGDLEEASRRLGRAVAAEPDNSRYWCDLGGVYFYLGNVGDALAATERALDLQPGHPGFLHNLAEYHETRFRANPIRHVVSGWRAWRLRREAAKAGEKGWRRDLWQPSEENAESDPKEAPPPA